MEHYFIEKSADGYRVMAEPSQGRIIVRSVSTRAQAEVIRETLERGTVWVYDIRVCPPRYEVYDKFTGRVHSYYTTYRKAFIVARAMTSDTFRGRNLTALRRALFVHCGHWGLGLNREELEREILDSIS